MAVQTIFPAEGAVLSEDVSVPASKSLTNRALICAALATGESRLHSASDSQDTRLMMNALRALRVDVATWERSEGQIFVNGAGPPTKEALVVHAGNAGTVMRFLTSFAALGRGEFTLDCDERMRERPIGGLVDALRALGAKIEYPERDGYPPLVVHANGLNGGRVRVAGTESSQFASSLLLASPYARGPVELDIEGTVSRPYVEMTRAVMAAFAGRDGRYEPREYTVEADAAAAGYFFALAAITGRRARVQGIGSACRQPEIALLRDLERMGCKVSAGREATEVTGPRRLKAIDADMNDHPDSVPALAVVALFAGGVTRIRNVRHLRFKESDRLAALASGLVRLGARVVEHADGLEIAPSTPATGAEIDSQGDHRIAMAFAVAGAGAPGVSIKDPDCVQKSFPRFWEELSRAGVLSLRV